MPYTWPEFRSHYTKTHGTTSRSKASAAWKAYKKENNIERKKIVKKHKPAQKTEIDPDLDRDICAECGGVSVRNCKCELDDHKCANGHEWHYCPKHGKRVSKHHDHKNSSKCTCDE
jgi:hypothetical protein